MNNTYEPQKTTVYQGDGESFELELKENEIKCTNGCVYTNEFEGFIPKILSDYFAKRKEYKKMMMNAEREKYRLIEILKEREKKLKNNLEQ